MRIIPSFKITKGAQVFSFLGFPKNKLVVIWFFIGSILSAEPIFEAEVYLQGTDSLIFYKINEIQTFPDSTILIHKYLNVDQSLAAIDFVKLENNEISHAFTKFFQVDGKGEIIRKGNRLLMKFSNSKEVKEKDIDYPDDLLVGPLFNRYVHQHWQTLLSGKSMDFQLPAPEILQTATFTLKKVDSEYAKSNHVAFQLSPKNILLKLFVDESYFIYDLQTMLLMSIHGNTILKTKIDGKYTKTTNVDIYYRYPEMERKK